MIYYLIIYKDKLGSYGDVRVKSINLHDKLVELINDDYKILAVE